ncbi:MULTISPECIES: hypothetical protein [unclassified Serratia (in: enterobacteria)]|uniref:hypothetical protein n=1 Tax=unclassified Serratia (in: enterobacteria) TaxID=2647522 RepID=UPI000A63E1B3|nr:MULTISPECIES: hypothetical protein [unclassified Serratia (in: enterobacteria)]
MKYCLIANNVVVNVIEWDGEAQIQLGDMKAISVGDDVYVGPGFLYDGKKFTAPEQTEK